MSQIKFIELSTLQDIIKNNIGFIQHWVKVEVESCNESSSGHYYLELLEKDPNGVIVAKASARIWRSNAHIIDQFTLETGKEIKQGISIVVKATVQYNARYGLSLSISEIDSNFSIGLREKEKRETIKKLEDAGRMEKQKGLSLPYLPSSIAIISSSNAAGYGDFVKHLNNNAEGFRYNYTLFQSLMQGDSAPANIIEQLEDIEQTGQYNLVLILRGGGAESDMFCFDDYDLCEAVADFPIPVITAIGHEKDYHVIDMVAHSYCKTPTALAAYLIEWTQNVEADMLEALGNVKRAFKDLIDWQDRRLNDSFNIIKYYLSDRVNVLSQNVDTLFSSISRQFDLRVENMSTTIDSTLFSIISSIEKNIIQSDKEVERSVSTIQFAFSTTLSRWDQNIAMIVKGIESSDPRGILRQGYVLAVDKDGTILKNVHSKAVGDDFSVRFSDGLWDCLINDIKENNKIKISKV